jgi:hypothetical protein
MRPQGLALAASRDANSASRVCFGFVEDCSGVGFLDFRINENPPKRFSAEAV